AFLRRTKEMPGSRGVRNDRAWVDFGLVDGDFEDTQGRIQGDLTDGLIGAIPGDRRQGQRLSDAQVLAWIGPGEIERQREIGCCRNADIRAHTHNDRSLDECGPAPDLELYR